MSSRPESTGGADTGEESFLGALSIVGAISFCCIGLGTAVGTAALAGGFNGAPVAIGTASARWYHDEGQELRFPCDSRLQTRRSSVRPICRSNTCHVFG